MIYSNVRAGFAFPLLLLPATSFAQTAEQINYEQMHFYIGTGISALQDSSKLKPKYDMDSSAYLQAGYAFDENLAIEATYTDTIEPLNKTTNSTLNAAAQIKSTMLNWGYTTEDVDFIESANASIVDQNDISTKQYGLFATYRTSGYFYGKVKLGIIQTETKVEHSSKINLNLTYKDGAPGYIQEEIQTNYGPAFSEVYASQAESKAKQQDDRSYTRAAAGVGIGYAVTESVWIELEATKSEKHRTRYSLGVNFFF